MSYNKGYDLDFDGEFIGEVNVHRNEDAVHNDFEAERSAAVQTHLSAGFTKYRQENGIIELLITREQYFRQKANSCGTMGIG